MRQIWKQLPKDTKVTGQWAALYVTMNPKGRIVMSRITWERLGEPAAFHILFDDVNSRIGLKPTSPAMRDAYRTVKTGSSKGRTVFAFRLMHEYNIRLPYTVQFDDAEIDPDGMLILDLRMARISPRAATHHRNRAKQEKTREILPGETRV